MAENDKIPTDDYERELDTDLDDETRDKPKGMALHTKILIGLLVGVLGGLAVGDHERHHRDHALAAGGRGGLGALAGVEGHDQAGGDVGALELAPEPAGVLDGTCFRFTVTPRHNPSTRVELRVLVA